MRLAHVHMKQFEEYRPYIDTLILPIGTIEAHGPHAPLGTDLLIPKRLADHLERQLSGRVWTAPEIPYGSCRMLSDFPGTIDVPASVFTDYVYAVVASFARWGLKHVVLLNGHGGNIEGLQEVATRLTEQGLTVKVSNYWQDYAERIAQITPGGGHAGEDETSLMLAIDPQSVDLSLAGRHVIEEPQGEVDAAKGKELYPQAFSGDAQAASEEKGEKLLDLIGRALVEEITAMWSANS
ncbi:MAG TPA: creatininase family protein [Bacilli bacterium]|nr:creatininase family protein [Bacilli bacterium]